MTSFFGQGACQAIEDATELSNTLAQHFCFNSYTLPPPYSDNSLPEALKAYSLKREVRGKAISKFSANYAKVHTAQLPYGLGPAVRRVIFGWAPAWFWIWCLIWLYGEQPVVNSVS
jgi:salicylate hydroxylase